MDFTSLKKEYSSLQLLSERGRMMRMSIAAQDLVPAVMRLTAEQFRLLTMYATDERAQAGRFAVSYVFGLAQKNKLITLVLPVDSQRAAFPSIFEAVHSALLYELEIRDMFGITPEGNPDLFVETAEGKRRVRRLVHHHNWPEGEYPLRKDFPWNKRPREEDVVFPFRYSEGEGVFEIPVGPIHAGVIEPGHFRFTAVGEMILNLEIRLWYSHRGVEKLFEQKSLPDAVRLAEHISGDTSFAHSLAFCEAAEELANLTVPERARLLRVIFFELERVYNHVGDIGMIGVDAAFAFAGAQGARLKELAMRVNDRLTGSRVLRGVNTVGGVTKDIAGENAAFLEAFVGAFEQDFDEFVNVLVTSSSLLDRLETTGRLKEKTAFDYDTVGVVARAAGLKRDARKDFPSGAWNSMHFTVPTADTGDVFARFDVRVREVRQSLALIKEALARLPEGPLAAAGPVTLKEGETAVSIVEGWRGELVHAVVAGPNNTLFRVKVRDASFVNWPTLSRAILNNIVPDFPLCNKSYNMSYAGNDL